MLVFINIYIMTQVGLLDLAYGHDIKDQKQHQAKQGNEHSLILRSKQYYDVKTSSYITDKDIVISSGIITAIVPRIKSIGNNQTLIDLGDINLFPGLIDMHAHLFLFDQTNNGDFQKALRKSTEMKNPIRLQKFKRRAKSYLSHGFTSVRDLGNSGQFLDVIQRQKEKTNNLFSPRLFVSGQGICTQACQFPIKTPAKEISQEYFHF